MYVVDSFNSEIRQISPAGVVTTWAGTGNPGNADGTGTAAMFSFPKGVALDASGTAYVADAQNNLIRQISTAAVVSRLAGSGAQGSADGTGTAASFYNPSALAVDSSGTVYVADSSNYLVRKISAAGGVSTFAGSGSPGNTNGTGTAAAFGFCAGIAVDAAGTVYLSDLDNHVIRKISPAGVVTTWVGTGVAGSANGTGTAASFRNPAGLAVDTYGTVYLADAGNHLIRQITAGGVVSTLAGSGSAGSVNGTGTAASFNSPYAVAVDASGAVYVSDVMNYLIRKIS